MKNLLSFSFFCNDRKLLTEKMQYQIESLGGITYLWKLAHCESKRCLLILTFPQGNLPPEVVAVNRKVIKKNRLDMILNDIYYNKINQQDFGVLPAIPKPLIYSFNKVFIILISNVMEKLATFYGGIYVKEISDATFANTKSTKRRNAFAAKKKM